MNFGVHDVLVLYLEEVKKLLDDVIHKMCAPVVQSRQGDSENLRLDRQDRVVNITARVNG